MSTHGDCRRIHGLQVYHTCRLALQWCRAQDHTRMDSTQWQTYSLAWARYAYQQTLQPRLNVKGRMAVVVLCAVIWAFAW